MESHVDLIRNNWATDEQEPVARIYVAPTGYGLIVKDAALGHWEGNIFDALGDVARGPGERIVETLKAAFHGPYLVASDAHVDDQCPFRNGPLRLETEKVQGPFVLPRLPAV